MILFYKIITALAVLAVINLIFTILIIWVLSRENKNCKS
jgi:hypothetical protein